MTRAVVFDVGGVLVDWDPRHLYRRLFEDEAAMEHFLATVCTQAWNEQQDRGRPFADGVAELVARYPEQAALIEAYDRRWDEMVRGAITGGVAVLAELRAAGIPLYALTNFSVEKFRRTRGRFAFLDWFDGIVVSGVEGLAKPDLAIFQLLCDRFDLDPVDAVFVDDSPANVEAARALGFDAVAFTSPERLRHDLFARGLLSGNTTPASTLPC